MWTRKPTGRAASLVGLTTAAAWLFSGYWGAMAVIGSIAFALGVAAVRARHAFRREAGRIAILTAAVLAGTLAVGVLSIPGRTEGGITIPRSADDLSVYAARPAEFLVPAPDNRVLGSITESIQPAVHGSTAAESTLYLGWLTIALAALWLVTTAYRRSQAHPTRSSRRRSASPPSSSQASRSRHRARQASADMASDRRRRGSSTRFCLRSESRPGSSPSFRSRSFHLPRSVCNSYVIRCDDARQRDGDDTCQLQRVPWQSS